MSVLADFESDVVFRVAEALRTPVLIVTILALAALLFEIGAFAIEVGRRRRRNFARLDEATKQAREALTVRGDRPAAASWVASIAWSAVMGRTLDFIVREWGQPGDEQRISKALADFDFVSLRRLERTRLLVRAGPALGLMGTLIPLSPALAGLAGGDVHTLTENLRVAFSVTVMGLLIGAVAFGISLVRDRLYGQDLSDLEYVASLITAPPEPERRP
ncbi:MotA/TolQ/ExbB proton channel family protein [Patulibacter sp. S7RM1-6]